MKTKQLDTEKLIILAQYLIYDELQNKPYKIDSEPIFVLTENGFQCQEPFFRYLIDELPYIFPEDWYETIENDVIWVLDEERFFKTSLEGFFGLTEDAVFHLLFPGRQNIERFAGKVLNNNSTHLDIAINIIEMVHKYNKQSIPINTIFLN